MTQVQDVALDLTEPHVAVLNPLIESVQVSLQSHPALEQINTPNQPGVISKFTECCFISSSRQLPALIGWRLSVMPPSKAASSGKRYKIRRKEPCRCSWNREAAAAPQPRTGPAMAAVLLHCRSCCNHQTRSRGGDAQRHLYTAAGKPCDIQASCGAFT